MHLDRFLFDGKEIAMNRQVGVFITMNPGYAGRSELPDNLKVLFRPVVMVVPDLELICEIMLLSEGFEDARVLARKMVVLYRLCRDQLSQQHHYDFGLRALKSALSMAGELKRNGQLQAPSVASAEQPLNEEAKMLIRALKEINSPKLVFDDIALFHNLVSDLFPLIETAPTVHAQLQTSILETLKETGYSIVRDQCEKIMQLNETMKMRHAVMVIGPSGGGKSVIIDTLVKANCRLGTAMRVHSLNPKAVSIHHLYGLLDRVTRDWTDGLLSSLFRDLNRLTEKKERRLAKDAKILTV